MLKKTLKIALISIGVLLLILLTAPFLFKGKIIRIVKQQVNNHLTAKVDFRDLDLSFFRHFPRISAKLTDLQVVGTEVFAADTLLSAKDIDVALNLMSVIKGSDYKIYSITVNEPRIHVIVTKDGQANYNITRPDTSTSTAAGDADKPFRMELQHYSINDGYISYNDAGSDMHSEIAHLDHSGSGDFTADLFTLSTSTKAGSVSFSYGGIPYLNNSAVSVTADIRVDARASKYSFKTDKVTVNALQLNTEGFFQLVNDSTYNMDVRFNMPSTDFKNLLSLVPAIYQKDFATVRTSGQAGFSGSVKGTYSATQIPAYHIGMSVKDGFFQYPDLPQAVQHIGLQLQVDNPDGVTDHTVIDLRQGHIETAGAPFDLRLLLKNPMTSRYIDAAVKGTLDLSKVSRFAKLDPGTQLAGVLNADVQAKGSVTAAQKQQLEEFNAAGTLQVSDISYRSKSYPDGIEIHHALFTFNPKNVTLSGMNGRLQQTNFTAGGSLSNLLGYALKDGLLAGTLTVTADKLDLNKWMTTDTTTAGGNTGQPAASGPVAVPANIDLTLTASVDQLHYDKTDYNKVTGLLLIKDETVTLKDVRMQALDGTIAMNGSYSTKDNKKNPAIAFSYDVQHLDVQKTFNAFNTVQKLMPVGKFISGTLNSSLSVKGHLGKDLMPEINSLTGAGNLDILQGIIGHFAPLDKVSSTLNLTDLKEIALKDIKNSFEFANGKVLIKPFSIRVKDIDMQIGGMHGIDQSIDYAINMKVPRVLMGSQANVLIDDLASRANARGVPVNVGETVNLDLKLGGTLTNPALKTNLKGTAGNMTDQLKQQALSFAQARADSAKHAVRDTVTALKNQVVSGAKEQLMKQLPGGNKDTAKAAAPGDVQKRATEAGKGLLKGLFGKKKDTADH